MQYVKAIIFIIGILDSLSAWLSKKGKINEVKRIEKLVDTGTDEQLANELRRLADKVEQRKKTA